MPAPDALRPARQPPGEVRVERAAVPLGALNRFFYVEVGRDFHWVDRLEWPAARWQAAAEAVETWLLYDRGTPAGYAELEQRADGTVNLGFFGLLAPFRGRGLGGHFLTQAIARAWELGPERVTLNTCELDGPYALDHYRARGFTLVREAIERRARSSRRPPARR
jgi:GNAT superfamily N-acetyltransferase